LRTVLLCYGCTCAVCKYNVMTASMLCADVTGAVMLCYVIVAGTTDADEIPQMQIPQKQIR